MKIKMLRYGTYSERFTLYDIDNMIIEYHNINTHYDNSCRDIEIINYGYTKSIQLAPFMLAFLRDIRVPFGMDLYIDEVKSEGGDDVLREVLRAMPYEFKDIIAKCLILIKYKESRMTYYDFENVFRIVSEEIPKEVKKAEFEYELNRGF